MIDGNMRIAEEKDPAMLLSQILRRAAIVLLDCDMHPTRAPTEADDSEMRRFRSEPEPRPQGGPDHFIFYDESPDQFPPGSDRLARLSGR
jgi:hypothetical protein